MKISQEDIAHVSDDDLKRMVVAAGKAGGSSHFWGEFARAVIRARRERVSMLAGMELDVINDDGPGAIVGPDDDPMADALAELRRAHGMEA